MKKIAIIVVIALLIACLLSIGTTYAAGEFEISAKLLDENGSEIHGEVNDGDVLNVEISFNTPYASDYAGYEEGNDELILELSGLSDMSIVSASLLVCTETSCSMVTDTDVLEFDGTHALLKFGYSGTITLSASVENSNEFVASILYAKGDSEESMVSFSTDVVVAENETTPVTEPVSEQESEPQNEAENDTVTTPKTGDVSTIPVIIVGILSVICLIALRKMRSTM